ncbi:hypothetical protein JW756_05625 [Candidatus Woesearchaeota archaeon]|nr:hypothetical protein [Candidatus Woesearchaeota archaeon]
MQDKNIIIEEALLVITVVLLLSLTMLVLEKTLPLSFQKITGAVVTTVNVTQPEGADCNFTLSQGLNLVSFFCIPNMMPRDFMIENITNLEFIFEYQEGSDDKWKSYNPALPSFVIQDLNTLSRTEGYWISVSSVEDFFLAGGLRLPTSIDLQSGWNLAGYPTNEIKSVNDSFASIDGNFTEVRTYKTLSGSFISYVPGVGGALNQTEPYYGYWINATTNEVWVVD